MKSITILDKDYLSWVQTLCDRYHTSQIRAASRVNQEMLHYYWLLGKDISERGDENKYGSAFYATLSRDLKRRMPDASGLSERNIRYARRFYEMFSEFINNLQQPSTDGQHTENATDTPDTQNLQQLVADLKNGIYQIPWGHHVLLSHHKFQTHTTRYSKRSGSRADQRPVQLCLHWLNHKIQ